MKYVAAVLLVSLIGCATSEETITSGDWREIISMAPLPPLAVRELELNVLFHILDNGSVTDVKIRGTSGDPNWDSLATESMKQWRFGPALHDSLPGGRWVQDRIIVKPGDQVVMTLGELVASSQGQADSLYSLLKRGSDFDTLVVHSSNAPFCKFGKFLGTIDIVMYPKHVRDELRKLSVNEITRPVRLGADYIIFKRYDPVRFRRLPQ